MEDAGPGGSPREILFVIGGLATGGAERQLLELCAGLDRTRWAPLVCALDAGHEFAREFAARGVPVVELARRGSFDLGRLLRLRALVRERRPALVHAFLVGPSLYARLALLLVRNPPSLIVAERSAMPRARRIVREVDRLLAGTVDLWIANAEAVRRAVLRTLAPRRPRVVVVPNGFRTADAPPDAGRRAATRQALGWGDDTVILAVGRLAPAKDYPTLIAAFARLLPRAGLRLAIAGEGPERANIEHTIRERDLPVTLLGLRADVPDLLHAADLFVLSSHVEGFPNVIGEALLAGLPVVSTDAGGAGELLRDGIDGRIVPIRDPEALADAIRAVLDDPASARRMAAEGGERIRREYSLEALIERTEAAYLSLLDPARDA